MAVEDPWASNVYVWLARLLLAESLSAPAVIETVYVPAIISLDGANDTLFPEQEDAMVSAEPVGGVRVNVPLPAWTFSLMVSTIGEERLVMPL